MKDSAALKRENSHISQRCESRNAVSSCGSASGSSVTSRRDVRAEIFLRSAVLVW